MGQDEEQGIGRYVFQRSGKTLGNEAEQAFIVGQGGESPFSEGWRDCI